MNDVDYGRLRSLTARHLVRALRGDGFFLDRQSGSHAQYMHPDGRRVTVSSHRSGDTFTPRLLRIIIGLQAKWTAADLRRLGLLD
ncbi:MAG TPA: addiction module toxin, HicA family [Dehalococcoidia bacterium]|nr:type II toxin-antitoxin system HicA family toxin [Dehalococcoidia bacterium]MEE2928679.1 type II toxin-antitoxin system HicA family toxin [Chloroflexota bacterium]HIB10523.1 addiction module toxin, HicA family [Dehalococcoidia bacterium]HIM49185.1 addiction module toxin, HicA family [Dehalococcoidia bacterium]